MNFKYYDVVSSLVSGYVLLVIVMYSFQIEYDNDYAVAYLALAFVCGYIVNSVGSLLEPIYYFTIGGKPSTRLLGEEKEGHNWLHNLFVPKNTGIKKVRFYETKRARKLLISGLEKENPSAERLFCKAMREVNGNQNARAHDFNAQYALSRTMLTTVILSTVLIIVSYPCFWQSYSTIIIMLICWNRYKERAYYYAREVLNEYLNQNKQ